jgi:hypothetical protein
MRILFLIEAILINNVDTLNGTYVDEDQKIRRLWTSSRSSRSLLKKFVLLLRDMRNSAYEIWLFNPMTF